MGKVILRPHSSKSFSIHPKATHTIIALYQNKKDGSWSYIEDSSVKVVKNISNDEYNKIKNKLNVFSIRLNIKKPYEVVCEMNESFGEKINESAKAIKNFWMNHHKVMDESGKYENPNLIESNYMVIFDEDDFADSQIENDNKIISARQAYLNLSEDEKKSAAILSGVKPFGINEKLLTNTMISLKEGVITKTPETATEFLKSLTKITNEVVVNSRNAILTGIVIMDGNTYYYDSSSLGRKQEDVEAYFQNNPSAYSLLVKDLKAKNAYIEIKAKEVKEELVNKKVKAVI